MNYTQHISCMHLSTYILYVDTLHMYVVETSWHPCLSNRGQIIYHISVFITDRPTKDFLFIMWHCKTSMVIYAILLPYNNLAKVCLPVEDDGYLCTDDPVKLRSAAIVYDPDHSLLSQYYSSDGMILSSVFGEPQREDGSEAEIEAVKIVLQDMYEYFENQVLVLDEYKTVRDRCKNKHDLCAFWTSIGECDVNRRFMVNECSASCRLCLHLHASFQYL